MKSIAEDSHGNLWLGSNDGLTLYNIETGNSLIFDLNDNLQGREFHVGSLLSLKDQSILMGGINGFNRFYPSDMVENTSFPTIVLTDFLVKGERRDFDVSTEYIEEIELNYRENFFTFEFKALDYTASSKNSYAYKLEGVDDNWIYIDDRSHVSYTNIEGGEYTFRVKSVNGDQNWSKEELVVQVRIDSPPWRRWWAYFSYISLILTFATVVLSWRLKQHKNEIIRNKMFVEKLEEKVLERTIELKLVNKKLERLSSLDDLTSLYNRRYFEERYSSEWSRLQRVNLPLSVLMCDIDHFKLYNDYYGHQAGDRCIKKVAGIITEQCVRPTDIAVRYGGEEFLIVLPQTDEIGAMKVANAIRASINEESIKHEYSSTSSHITISIGVSTDIPQSDIDPKILIEKADKALYECKNNGRDQIVQYSSDMSKLNKTR